MVKNNKLKKGIRELTYRWKIKKTPGINESQNVPQKDKNHVDFL
jgi:hypothetical protein